MSSCSLWLARRALLHTRGPVPRARTASETILPGCGLSIGLRGVRCACQRPRAMAGLVGPGGQLSRAMALGRPELSPAVKGGTCNHMRNIQPCRPFHEMHRPRPRMRARPVEAWKDHPDISAEIVRGASVYWHEFDAFRNNRRARISFDRPPKIAMIVKKPKNDLATRYLEEIASWLHQRGLQTLVEDEVYAKEISAEMRGVVAPLGSRIAEVDLCITLGGDGTVLFMGSLFPQDAPMPPVVSFSMGTLGFLTPYDVKHFRDALGRILQAQGASRLSKPGNVIQDAEAGNALRAPIDDTCLVDPDSSEDGDALGSTDAARVQRIKAFVAQVGAGGGGSNGSGKAGMPAAVLERPRESPAERPLTSDEAGRAGGPGQPSGRDKGDSAGLGTHVNSEEILDHMHHPGDRVVACSVPCTLRTRLVCEVWQGGEVVEVNHVLNECVVDRGVAMHALEVELWVDGMHVTNIRADSIIIGSPSGSTAYSMSAGGPIVSPSVPCMLITPVAPHSLSFRPVVVPDTSVVDIRAPCDIRTKPRASFDGRRRVRMAQGSYIRCYTAAFPLPMVTPAALEQDWYSGITEKLGWNHQIRVHKAPLESLATVSMSSDEGDHAGDGDAEEEAEHP